ncbi:hypothetical protein D7Y13_33970 [Corallococcus praedator]|uniref:Uncharacterized protein n=1 Tax=Corallococcus praedator TaxID=2316724 RepID=A0ABX9Q8D3_9BACT|nr:MULTISPECIES: hypothetical protein [Corallococcus]RKH03518.1 hypothetical protein D7X74_36210 [Corallococcus sp. CA047B]RKH21577.1 hypothetical protein D7X75_36795 [Corallococcus sp. CA031C]RKH93897.1 hypothetical protein D7Y13_33970 [Corallococcus praedator]
MSSPSLPRLVLILALVWGGAVVAQPQRRQPQDFQTRKELTQEEKDAAKARAMGNNLSGYSKDEKPKEKPMPWRAIGLAGIIFMVCLPFAIRAYRGTVKEMATANTFGAQDHNEDEA